MTQETVELFHQMWSVGVGFESGAGGWAYAERGDAVPSPQGHGAWGFQISSEGSTSGGGGLRNRRQAHSGSGPLFPKGLGAPQRFRSLQVSHQAPDPWPCDDKEATPGNPTPSRAPGAPHL